MSNIQLPLSKPSEIDDIKYDIKEVEAHIHKIGFEPQSPFDTLFDALLSLALKILSYVGALSGTLNQDLLIVFLVSISSGVVGFYFYCSLNHKKKETLLIGKD